MNKSSDGIVYIMHYSKICIPAHMVTMHTFLRSPLRPLARLCIFWPLHITLSKSYLTRKGDQEDGVLYKSPYMFGFKHVMTIQHDICSIMYHNMLYYITCITNPLSNIVEYRASAKKQLCRWWPQQAHHKLHDLHRWIQKLGQTHQKVAPEYIHIAHESCLPWKSQQNSSK